MTGSASNSAARRLRGVRGLSRRQRRALSLPTGILSITRAMSFRATMEHALKTVLKVRRFVARNWKFLVQVGVNILTVIMHR